MLNRELKEPAGNRWASTLLRIRSVGDPLVKYLLFSGEPKLESPIKGTAGFTEQFAKQGPRDSQGRSLRDFDLQTRFFKYPCSFLIHSPSFDAIEPQIKAIILQKLHDILTGKNDDAQFARLKPEDRKAVLEILIETKKTLPDYWRKP